MNLGRFHQDCIEKLKGKHVPRTCQERKERSEICGLGACIGQ